MAVLYPQSSVSAVVYRHGGPAMDVSKWITAFQANKPIGSQRGQAALHLKFPANWPSATSLFGDDDWVVIRLTSFGQTKPGLYFIDTVFESIEIGPKGAKVRSAQLSLSDCAKPAAVHHYRMWYGLRATHVPGLLQPDDELASIALGSASMPPGEVVRRLLNRIFRPVAVSVTKRKELRPVAPKPTKKPKPQPVVKNNQLAPGFALSDFTKGIKDTPPPDVQDNLATLAGYLHALQVSVFDGRTVTVIKGGGWEPPTPTATNRLQTSRHRLGQAADIRVEGLQPEDVAKLIQQAISAGIVPWGGLGLYSDFVHYDFGTGVARPAQWVGKNSKAPSEAQVAAVGGLSAWRTWRPSSSSLQVAESADEEQEAPEELQFEEIEVAELEVRAGASGEGAFVLPNGLSEAIDSDGQGASSFDWLDALDSTTWMNRPGKVQGAWWNLYALLRHSTTLDALARSSADLIFNEWFFDVRPVPEGSPSVMRNILGGWAPCLVFRRRPLDAEDWNRLPLWRLEDGSWRRVSRMKTGNERGTLHFARGATADLQTSDFTDYLLANGAGKIPAVDAHGARRHGLRPIETNAAFAYIVPLPDEARNAKEYLRDENLAFHRWNSWLPNAERIEVEVPYFSPKALVGTRVSVNGIESEPIVGYVTTVSEGYVVDGARGARHATTKLTLERCHQGQVPQPEPVSWKE